MSILLTGSSELGGEQKQPDGITQASGSTGNTTQQIMSRHMKDKNDVITEEDIRNLNIEPEISSDPANQSLQIADNKEQPNDEDKGPGVIMP